MLKLSSNPSGTPSNASCPVLNSVPIFRSARDASITKGIYQRVPVLINEAADENPWGISFMRMFDMSNDSGLFRTAKQLEAEGWSLKDNRYLNGDQWALPLYEAKLMHQFDHRFATYTENGDTRDMTSEEKFSSMNLPLPRYWIAESKVEESLIQRDKEGNVSWHWDRSWLLCFRKTARSTDFRTSIVSPLPRRAVGDKAPLILSSIKDISPLIANLNTYVLDFSARQKIGGIDISNHYFQQFPVLPPSAFNPPRLSFITTRVLELTYTAFDLTGFARDLNYPGDPFTWNDERRFWLRVELDALYFILYGIDRGDVDYIMDTFPIVKRKDVAAHGTYRTKDAILAIYDELQTLGLERLGEYQSRVLTLGLVGGDVAGGWRPTP